MSQSSPIMSCYSLAPPSPKRSRFAPVEEVEADTKPISRSATKHRTRAASISSVEDNKHSSPTPNVKQSSPVSTRKLITKISLKLKAPPAAAEDDNSDTENPAPRIHRNETQRIQFLKDHPDCGEFEPHRAFCLRCERWVALSGNSTYPLTRWNKHLEKCGQSATQPDPAPIKSEESDVPDEDSEDDKAYSVSGQASRRTRTEEERYAYLEADPMVREIKDHEVQCKTCQRRIKLGTDRKYMLTRWEQHKVRCTGSLPSGRVATANRRLQLVNDTQVKQFTTRSVDCEECNDTIPLEGEGEFNLARWLDHKSRCPKPRSGPSKPAQPSPISRSRRPASVASTDVTVVAPENSPNKGEKRRRETDGQEDDRRNVRARTETYDPPQENVPSIWQWVTLPFKAFLRGFREGLGTSSTSNA